jgi:hypothetical protein
MMERETALKIRPYNRGDEQRISEIFEDCYADHSGHITRTPGFWRWFNLERPGVSPEDVLVAVSDGEIMGCLTLAGEGELLDPCYDSRSDGTMVMTSLLSAAADRALERGNAVISLNVPLDNLCMNEACRRMGMRCRDLKRSFSISIEDHEAFLNELLRVADPPEGSFSLRILRNGRETKVLGIDVSPSGFALRDHIDPDVAIKVEDGTFSALVLKGLSPWDWILRRISFWPPWRFRLAFEFVGSLKVAPSWFVPRGGMF